MSHGIFRSLALALCLVCSPSIAQESLSTEDPSGLSAAVVERESTEDAAHDQLRQLRDGLTNAINEMRIDDVLSFLADDVVVTWLDGSSSRGHDEVRAYLNDKLSGDAKIVEKFRIEPKVSDLTILYGGDTGVSYGTGSSHFDFSSRRDLAIEGPWSATLVKEGDRWVVASFHASAGLFKNPLIAFAYKALWWTGGLTLLLGIVIGAYAGRKSKRS